MEEEGKERKYKRRTWVYLGIFSFLSLLIIVESAIPGGASSIQSDWLANISAFFINLFGGNDNPVVVKPESITLDNDSSFLGQGQIAIGSSSRLTFTLHYPQGDAYDQNFEVTRVSGTKEDYEIVVSQGSLSNATLTNSINVVGLKEGTFSISASSGEVSCLYEFDIVPLAEPTEFEVSQSEFSLDIHESCVLPLYLLDSSGTAASRVGVDDTWSEDRALNEVDHYLRRVYDPSRIPVSFSDPSVASLSADMVLTGLKEGTTTLTLGKENPIELTVNVSSSIYATPSSFHLASEGSSYLNDYDYFYEGGYGLTITAETEGDVGVASFSITNEDNIHARLKRIDERTACLLGYRTKGKVVVSVDFPGTDLESKTIEADVSTALPTSMNLNIGNEATLSVGSFLYVNGVFAPKNVPVTGIEVVDNSEPDVISVSGNGTASLTLGGTKSGTAVLAIRSVLNPSLEQTLAITVTDRPQINEDNVDDFASWLRKFGGHFLLFGAEAVFGYLFFHYLFEKNKYRYIYATGLSLASGLFFGMLSELIQLYTPDRTGAWSDVGIDFLGALLGTLVVFLIFLSIDLVKKHQSKKKDEKEETPKEGE